jgi:oligosaccharyltransferase complex subunit beta
MCRAWAVIATAVLLLGAACSASPPAAAASQKVLVLLEGLDLQESHSEFFGGLSSRGYQLDFKQISDKKLQLKNWDEWLYDKVIIFATKGGAWGRRRADA